MKLKIGVENTLPAFALVQLLTVEFRMDFQRFFSLSISLPTEQMADKNLSLMVSKLSQYVCVESEFYGQWFI